MKPQRQHPALGQPMLAPGQNCWVAAAPVQAAGLLIDARSYYRAFYQVAQQAQRYILIAGWKLNSDVRLLRGLDAAANGGEVRFLPFLNRLCEENPRLHILAEHCGLRHRPELRRHLQRKKGLVEYLDHLAAARSCRLRHLTREAIFEDREWLKQLERWGFSFDPEKPLIEETFYEQLMPDSDSLLARGLCLPLGHTHPGCLHLRHQRLVAPSTCGAC